MPRTEKCKACDEQDVDEGKPATAKKINLYQRQKHETDLVLLDIGLPKVAGWDVIQKMKEVSSSINIIVSSGYLDLDFRAKLHQTGVKHFLDKPYTTDAVVETLHAVLEESDSSNYPD